MKTLYRCDYCGYETDFTVGGKLDMEDHEEGCKKKGIREHAAEEAANFVEGGYADGYLDDAV